MNTIHAGETSRLTYFGAKGKPEGAPDDAAGRDRYGNPAYWAVVLAVDSLDSIPTPGDVVTDVVTAAGKVTSTRWEVVAHADDDTLPVAIAPGAHDKAHCHDGSPGLLVLVRRLKSERTGRNGPVTTRPMTADELAAAFGVKAKTNATRRNTRKS